MGSASKSANANTIVSTGWFSASLAYTNDSNYATASPAKNTSHTSDFGFPAFTTSDIPTSACITKTSASLFYKSNTVSSAGAVIGIQLNKNGTLMEAEITGAQSLSDVTVSTSALSGVSASDLSSANTFLVRARGARASSNTAITWSLNYVKLAVDWNYDVDCTKLSVALASTAANFSKGKRLTASALPVALSGNNVNLTKGTSRTLPTTKLSIAVTGYDVSLTKAGAPVNYHLDAGGSTNTYSDDFNRDNENPIAGNWVGIDSLSSLKILNQTCMGQSTDSCSYWDGVFSNDHWSEAKVITQDDGGPAVRCDNGTYAGCYYWTPVGGGGIWRYRNDGTLWVKLSATSFSITASDVVRLGVSGCTPVVLTVYKNGASQVSVNDTDNSHRLAAGYPGLYSLATTVLDDWSGGDSTITGGPLSVALGAKTATLKYGKGVIGITKQIALTLRDATLTKATGGTNYNLSTTTYNIYISSTSTLFRKDLHLPTAKLTVVITDISNGFHYGYHIDTVTATIALTGYVTGFLRGRNSPVSTLAITLSSPVAGLYSSRKIGSQPTLPIALTGYITGLKRNYNSSVTSLPVAFSSYPSGLKRNYNLSASTLQLAIGSSATGIKRGRVLAVSTLQVAISSSPSELKRNYNLSSSVLQIALTGISATLSSTAGAKNYTLTASTASLAIGFYATGLKRSSILSATSFQLAISGVGTGLKRGYYLDAATSQLSFSSYATGLKRSYSLTATKASLAFSVYTTGLLRGTRMSSGTLPVSLTSYPIAVRISHTLPTTKLSVLYNSNNIGSLIGHILTATTKAIALTPQSVTMSSTVAQHLVLSTSTAQIALTGYATSLTRTYKLSASTLSVAVSCKSILSQVSLHLSSATSTVALTGYPVTLSATQRQYLTLPATALPIVLTSYSTGLNRSCKLSATTYQLAYQSRAIGFVYGHILNAQSKSIALTLRDASFSSTVAQHLFLTADTGSIALSSYPVGLNRGYKLSTQTLAGVFSGKNISSVYGHVLSAQPGQVALSARDTSFILVVIQHLTLPAITSVMSTASPSVYLTFILYSGTDTPEERVFHVDIEDRVAYILPSIIMFVLDEEDRVIYVTPTYRVFEVEYENRVFSVLYENRTVEA